MTIYRGPGGTGDATSDSDTTEFQQFLIQTVAAKDAAIVAETAAETAASAASGSASSAATSATAATSSASAASTSAANAAASASTASTQATNAASSASAASTSATAAASSATAAALSATSASDSASTATTKASEASTSASNAATSASSASTSASTATTQASNAATSASNAATSATGASAAQTAAEAARDAALSAYDNFDDRYLGPKATDPTLDNDGNALLTGALYFDTSTSVMKVYTGSAWVAAYVSAAGVLLTANNLSDLNNTATARTNLNVPTRTGGDASGTWGINVTGNAATVTNGVYTTGDQTIAGVKTLSSNPILSAGTANGVPYLNGSKVLTSGSALVFDGTNLGIGTSSPSTPLDVQANSSALGIRVRGRASGDSSSVAFYSNNNATQQLSIFSSNSENAFFGSGSMPMTFSTNSAERMRLDSSGNLGLGVTPSAWGSQFKTYELPNGVSLASVVSSANLGLFTNVYYNGSNYIYKTTAAATEYEQVNGIHKWYNAPSGTAGNAISFTQAMTLDASGQLGVGTTSPTARLEVLQTVGGAPVGQAATIIAQSADSVAADKGGSISFGGKFDSSNYTQWAAVAGLKDNATSGQYGGYLSFYTRTNGSLPAERARIDSSGNLLVGTTSTIASARSVIAGGASNAQVVYFNNTRNNGSGDATAVSILGAADNNTSNYHFIGTTGGNDRVFIFGNGNIQNTNNSYGAISDAKLKENITDAMPKLEKLQQVRVVNYNLIGDEQKQIGVIAQELEQVFPGMVEEAPDRDKDGNDLGTTTKSVKYSVFVPMLIKAMQEQQALILSLQADVAALKAAA